jgi:hypothetical protein
VLGIDEELLALRPVPGGVAGNGSAPAHTGVPA